MSVVWIECLPDERPGWNDHRRCNDYDHDEHVSFELAILIHKVESGIEDQELRGCVYGPATQEEERVHWPEGLRAGKEVFQDDPDGIDGAAPGSE